MAYPGTCNFNYVTVVRNFDPVTWEPTHFVNGTFYTYDIVDLCPDVAGPVSNRGCPIYEKVVVKPDKLELKEKFAAAAAAG